MNFERTVALLGPERFERLRAMHVTVYGLGGVGGWCAEALLRSGVGRLTLVDDDVIQPSNLNRQCCAVAGTIGCLNAEAMKARLLEIDPEADIAACCRRFTPGDVPIACDAIVDAIDSVDCKCALVLAAGAAGIPIVSSLGAAKRTDPTKVALGRFRKVEGDALARAMRSRFRKGGCIPDFLCAYSTEKPMQTTTLGSVMPVTASFGMALAAAIVGDLKGESL